jgi:glycosyltransferase involved in cell wall biosynthesis
MRILNVMQCTELGGMEQSALRFMAGFQARGHSCQVVSVNPIGRLGPLLKAQDIPAVGVPFRGKLGWRSHLQLRRAIRDGLAEADALAMTGPTLSGVLALGRRRTMRRVLNVQFHHTGVKPPWTWRGLYRLVAARFDAVTFPSDFTRNEAEELWPPLKPITHTVRNPMPLPDLPDGAARAEAGQALGLPTGAPVVGNAGWLIPRKRFDVFLRVAAVIRRSVPSAVFVIAGDGPDRAALEALAAELGIAPAVRWLGWQRDLGPLYRALDVLLFNAEWDAFPTTPLEAMSYAVPVIASVRHGGLKEAITDSAHGLLLHEHDEARLAAAAVELLRDPDRAREVGLAARDRVGRLCAFESCVGAYEDLLCGRRAAGVR